VEVDREEFNVKVSPLFSGESTGSNPVTSSAAQSYSAPEETPEGAMISDIAGLVISIKIKVGDRVEKGDDLMVIESMKMMRNYSAPHGGIVKEIWVKENQTINVDDILMLVI
jgi:pyruvate carboxylase subunit B